MSERYTTISFKVLEGVCENVMEDIKHNTCGKWSLYEAIRLKLTPLFGENQIIEISIIKQKDEG